MARQDEDDAKNEEVSGSSVVPLHAVVGTIKRGPGRPRKIEVRPTVDDVAYHMRMAEDKNRFMTADSIVRSAQERTDTVAFLQTLKAEMAREAAALAWQRTELAKYGKDTTQISSRRIAALKEIASLELDIKRMGSEAINLRSEPLQRVFKLYLETLRDVAREVLSPELFDLLWNKLETALDGWEDRAESLVR